METRNKKTEPNRRDNKTMQVEKIELEKLKT